MIGIVGITGLINVHREEKAEKELKLMLRAPGYWASDPAATSERGSDEGPFQMDRLSGSLIHFQVNSLSQSDRYRLEFGNGENQLIRNALIKRYTKPGIHLVKLFRNGDLIAIRHLEITCSDLQISTL